MTLPRAALPAFVMTLSSIYLNYIYSCVWKYLENNGNYVKYWRRHWKAGRKDSVGFYWVYIVFQLLFEYFLGYLLVLCLGILVRFGNCSYKMECKWSGRAGNQSSLHISRHLPHLPLVMLQISHTWRCMFRFSCPPARYVRHCLVFAWWRFKWGKQSLSRAWGRIHKTSR